MLEDVQLSKSNVLKLVSPLEVDSSFESPEELSFDPLMDLMTEFDELLEPQEEVMLQVEARPMVANHMSEDQIWLTLKNQLRGMNETTNRLRYILSEIDDSIRK